MQRHKSIQRFLEKYSDGYIYIHHIEFGIVNDCIVVNYEEYNTPDHRNFDFALIYPSESNRSFIEDFGVHSPWQLNTISSADLWKLFWKGKVLMYCGLNIGAFNFPLFFKVQKQQLIVMTEDYIGYEVFEDLKTMHEFLHYTERQFHQLN